MSLRAIDIDDAAIEASRAHRQRERLIAERLAAMQTGNYDELTTAHPSSYVNFLFTGKFTNA